MASRIVSKCGPQSRRQNKGTTFVLNEPDPAIRTRDGLAPRVVWLPASVIEQHDREAGQLTALMTLALSAYLATAGKGGER